MRRAARVDATQAAIVAALRAQGASVIDTSGMGQGFPDLILGYAGKTLLMEIKNPKTSYGRRGLNKNQEKWRQAWTGGPYSVVTDVPGALSALRTLEDRTEVTE